MDEAEWKTRRNLIDKRLCGCNPPWTIIPLSLVREHLVKNLPMDEEDFDLTPLLEMRGGRAKARKVFGDIRKLVEELNEAVAA